MQFRFLQPRYWVAIGLGVGSALLLSILLMEGGLNAGSDTSDPPVLISTGAVQAGQTLASVLARENLPNPVIYKIQSTLGKSFNLRRMRPGDRYTVVTSTWGLFRELVYNVDDVQSYVVRRSSMGVYSCTKEEQKTVWMETVIEGTINDNLYNSLLAQGYSNRLADYISKELENRIFAWRIDFFTEQRKGDRYAMLMEQKFKLGSDKPLSGGQGRILLAFYEGSDTKKKENYAVAYKEAGKINYFDSDGKAVRKIFRRAPFNRENFRISSHFNPRRFHPIKRVYRPHHGTDYAAARGTPVAAIGRGKVILAGWKGAYGKTIEIRHSKKYTSRYGHLSRIKVKKGQMVEQGQYIGNVGSTGLSTGPHLHFEMIVYGKQKNFLRMDFPSASSVSAKNKDDFFRTRDQYLQRLNLQPGV